MTREYDVVFKLPCEKTFKFNIFVCEDEYDPTKEIGRYPSHHLQDYFLLYVPSLKDYSGFEISNGIVMSVSLKKNDDTEPPSVKSETKNDPEPTPSFKSLYWKNGYIVNTRGNGYGIISNDVIFCNAGSIHKTDLDDSLMGDSCNANDIIEVWDNTAICHFNPYSAEDVHRHCRLVWTRPIVMTRTEIERKLNLPKGSLVIKD